jgi:hypothetical protein
MKTFIQIFSLIFLKISGKAAALMGESTLVPSLVVLKQANYKSFIK